MTKDEHDAITLLTGRIESLESKTIDAINRNADKNDKSISKIHKRIDDNKDENNAKFTKILVGIAELKAEKKTPASVKKPSINFFKSKPFFYATAALLVFAGVTATFRYSDISAISFDNAVIGNIDVKTDK